MGKMTALAGGRQSLSVMAADDDEEAKTTRKPGLYPVVRGAAHIERSVKERSKYMIIWILTSSTNDLGPWPRGSRAAPAQLCAIDGALSRFQLGTAARRSPSKRSVGSMAVVKILSFNELREHGITLGRRQIDRLEALRLFPRRVKISERRSVGSKMKSRRT